MKKIVACLLVSIIALTAAPISVHAASTPATVTFITSQATYKFRSDNSKWCVGWNYVTSGTPVYLAQKILKQVGCNPGTIDGLYGKETISAIFNYQLKYRLKTDNIVGQSTWTSFNTKVTRVNG